MVQFAGNFPIFTIKLNQLNLLKRLTEIFRKNNGIVRMKYLRQAGIHNREISSALTSGLIEKIKPGLYKLAGYPWDENSSFVDICAAKSSSVICLISAAVFYEFTTFNPPEIHTAIPNHSRKINLAYPPVKVYYFSGKYYSFGIETHKAAGGIFHIYSEEKTIIDLFRYRQKIGDDLAFESLKSYLRKSRSNPGKLINAASQLGTEQIILPSVKAMMI